jgi:hypothetical protein
MNEINIEDLLSDLHNPKPKPTEQVKHICPCCKSVNTYDNSVYEHNGIMGPGAASYLVQLMWCCSDCGVLFKPVNKQTNKQTNNGNKQI